MNKLVLVTVTAIYKDNHIETRRDWFLEDREYLHNAIELKQYPPFFDLVSRDYGTRKCIDIVWPTSDPDKRGYAIYTELLASMEGADRYYANVAILDVGDLKPFVVFSGSER